MKNFRTRDEPTDGPAINRLNRHEMILASRVWLQLSREIPRRLPKGPAPLIEYFVKHTSAMAHFCLEDAQFKKK
jgi:hypothetical protein